MPSIDLKPKICNICGGEVELVKTTSIYGHNLKYGKKCEYCYHCKKCDAIVSTRKDDPTTALGILADKETAQLRQKCHDMFDKFWKNSKQRTTCYTKLAQELGIEVEDCHFAFFDKERLNSAYQILLKWWREKYDY